MSFSTMTACSSPHKQSYSRSCGRGGVSALGLVFALGACLMLAAVLPGLAVALPSTNPEKHFELVPGSFSFAPSTDQAGAHSDWVTKFDFAHNSKGQTVNDVRSTTVNLPAGFSANDTAVPTCTTSELISAASIELGLPSCPPGSTVGKISFDFGGRLITVPIYNMEVTSFGVTAELGFLVYTSTQLLTVSVRPGDEGLTVTDPEIENLGEPHDITVTIWGVPAAREHNVERQQTCEPPQANNSGEEICANKDGGSEAADIPAKPYLSNPTSCEPHIASMTAYPWEEPANIQETSFETPSIGECERVPFSPSLEAQPSTRSAESPTGLAVSLLVPQSWENPYSIATAIWRHDGRAPGRHDDQPVRRLGAGGVHARAIRVGNILIAAGRRLSAGIEDRVDRNRNAGPGGEDLGRGVCRETVR